MVKNGVKDYATTPWSVEIVPKGFEIYYFVKAFRPITVVIDRGHHLVSSLFFFFCAIFARWPTIHTLSSYVLFACG